jgi:hypothetical protein
MLRTKPYFRPGFNPEPDDGHGPVKVEEADR